LINPLHTIKLLKCGGFRKGDKLHRTLSFAMILVMRNFLLGIVLLAVPASAWAQVDLPLQTKVETILKAAGPGTRFGLVVADDSGREIVAVNPDGRFIPASNTKMFTTAAAYASMSALDQPDVEGGTSVALQGKDVILTGYGDARMSSAADCKVDCLATLADAVAAKTKRVRHIIGDATLWPDTRWSPGMSWNNVAERSGTGVAALSLDSNELALTVRPTYGGMPATIGFASDYFSIDNRATTIARGPNSIDVKRLPFERRVILFGQIAAGDPVDKLDLGIDDPAHYAAWRLAALLKERGVKVKGEVKSRYRDDPPPFSIIAPGSCPKKGCPKPVPVVVLARLTPPPLAEDIKIINKVSQNLHADLLVRRLGGGLDKGLAAIEKMLTSAGVPRTAYDFSDGSGMSTYNRTAPRGTVTFLRWVKAQPWGAAWRASLPVGGVDGTIGRRFKGTSLDGRIFAKTGGLNATAALSGYMIAKSGRELTFSILANDMPAGTRATATMDAALIAISEAN
jgi:serine-type D-Ala-D-Ala carboxypeptidase/endopeptidase (penicillin-binding protein 4)